MRPEPQCFWSPRLTPEVWARAHAVFDPSGEEDEGRWRMDGGAPERFELAWDSVRFHARFTPFRHLAFFPEQAANWAWLKARCEARPLRVLNLFGYTGVASLVCAAAGAQVTHVDASKKSVAYARENAAVSGLADRPIRWLTEDARKWVQREGRRGALYDGIILDPPKYGRGPGGEVWRLFEDLPALLSDCAALLAADADFLLLNGYAARISSLSLAHLVNDVLRSREGVIDWGELALVEAEGREIGLSFFARWSAES